VADAYRANEVKVRRAAHAAAHAARDGAFGRFFGVHPIRAHICRCCISPLA
jgi:hypothetical protein